MRAASARAVLVVVGLSTAQFVALPSTPASAATAIKSCTESAVAKAVKNGGSYAFKCDGTITITKQLRMDSGHVSLDGTGQAVTLQSGVNAPNAFSRLFFVNG